MNTYLQMSALAYIILIGVIYFGKRNIDTVENKIFGSMIFHTFIVLVLDILSRLYAIYYPITKLSEYLFKLNICFFAGYLILYSYYVFVLTSKKNAGLVSYKDNPNKEYFKTSTLVMIIFVLLIMCIIIPLPITLLVEAETLVVSGPAMTFAFIVGALCMIAWVVMMLSVKDKTRYRKFVPIYVFIALGIFTMVLQFLIPQICFISTMIAFITVMTFYTIENPDVNLVQKLNIAKQEAESANQTKTDFLSSMSHEIRTPLNAIVGFTDYMVTPGFSDAEREEFAKIIKMNSEHLLNLVNDILDLSRIEAGMTEYKDKY